MKRQLFELLDIIPDEIDESGCVPVYEISAAEIKNGVHRRIISEQNPRPASLPKKRRYFIPAIAAALLVTGAIAAGSIIATGQDNYDYYSPQTQAAKTELEREYRDMLTTELEKMVNSADIPDKNSSYYSLLAAGEAKMKQYKRVYEIVREHGFLDKLFSDNDIFYREDEFISACCNAFKQGGLDTKEKTRIYMYLSDRLLGIYPYTEDTDGRYKCSESAKKLIEKTISLYYSPMDEYDLDAVKKMWSEMGYEYDTDEEYTENKRNIIESYSLWKRQSAYEQTEEYNALSSCQNDLSTISEEYFNKAITEYRAETGVDLNVDHSGENSKKLTDLQVLSEGEADYEYYEKVHDIKSLFITEEADHNLFLNNTAYVRDLFRDLARRVTESNTVFTLEERAILQTYLSSEYNRLCYIEGREEGKTAVHEASVFPVYYLATLKLNIEPYYTGNYYVE